MTRCLRPTAVRVIRTLISSGFALLLFVIAPSAHAATPANFERANRLYETGNFEGARAALQALVDSGNYSANLFYNLGNADYRLGKKGDAFLAYERALALEPSHPEARANLSLLRDETGARLSTPSWTERAFTWPDDPLQKHVTWLAAAAFWVICLSFAPLAYKGRPSWLPAILGALTLAWCGAAYAVAQSRGKTWIATEAQVSARVAPADGSEMAGTLPMGSHVQLLLERGPWVYVVLPGQNKEARGWVPRSAVEPIALQRR